jgi:hypothetical protein
LSEYEDEAVRILEVKGRKYNKLSRLSAMVDMGWIERAKQEAVEQVMKE